MADSVLPIGRSFSKVPSGSEKRPRSVAPKSRSHEAIFPGSSGPGVVEGS